MNKPTTKGKGKGKGKTRPAVAGAPLVSSTEESMAATADADRGGQALCVCSLDSTPADLANQVANAVPASEGGSIGGERLRIVEVSVCRAVVTVGRIHGR